MSAHSTVVGGSSAARVRMCPASVKLSEEAAIKFPPRPPSPYAQEGTALHTVMEQSILQYDELVPRESFIGLVIEGVKITRELYDKKLVPAGQALEELFKQHDVVEYEPEARVHFTSIPGAFGTCDILALTRDGKLLIVDFKFGDGVIVDAYNNTQMKFYGAATLEDKQFSDFTKALTQDSTVIGAIIQPAREGALDVAEYTVKELATLAAELAIAVHAAEKPLETQTPNPGDWCRWCPAAPLCPAKLEEAERHPAIDTTTAEGLAEAMKLADAVEPWIRSVRKQVHELMEQGNDIPGFKLVRTRAQRKWIDEEGIANKLKYSKKLKRGDYLTEKMVSPPQLEKICKQKGVDFSDFDAYYDAVSSGTAVVAETNPAPAIKTKNGKTALGEPPE